MAGNHRKVLPNSFIERLESLYSFNYNKDNNTIEVYPQGRKIMTSHDASKSFVIVNKKLNKKFIFYTEAIDYWIKFLNTKYNKYSLFRINNAVNELKIFYLEINEKNIIRIIENGIFQF